MSQPLDLYQDSSGGEQWRSPTHRNRNGVITTSFRGYRLNTAAESAAGQSATPGITLEGGRDRIGVTMEQFCQKFPKAVEAGDRPVGSDPCPAVAGARARVRE